mgnify:CR=1 FL=1
MKTLKSTTVLAMIGLLLMATQSYAQRGNRANRANRMNNCYQDIPNLTEKQSQQIQEMRTAHFNQMAELRNERRSTANWDQKDAVRERMLQKQQEHRNEIRSLLTDDQKTWFDSNYQKYRNNRSGRGNGSRGNGNCGGRKGGGNRNW